MDPALPLCDLANLMGPANGLFIPSPRLASLLAYFDLHGPQEVFRAGDFLYFFFSAFVLLG